MARRTNPLALAVLACLHERPMHPYEVAQTLRYRAKHESIRLNYGSLYNVVDGLERRGLIEARETVREGRRPERTIYEITDTGRRELVDWMSDLLTTPAKEYLQFEAALSLLPALPPDVALDRLRDRTMALKVAISRTRAAIATGEGIGLPRLLSLEGTYRLALLEAELGFTEELVKAVETGALDGLDLWRSWYRPDGTVDHDALDEAARRFATQRDEHPPSDDPGLDR